MNWYDYPICIVFGDPNADSDYGGAHDMDVRTPPNTPVTALLPAKITSITAPSWGKQIGMRLDVAYKTIPYIAYLHLSAIHPALVVGSYVSKGDIIGWSGGCTDASQYAGTANPTGHNFLNDPSQSSQPQTGLALMRGPEYGTDGGWSIFPPVDRSLDPTQLIIQARAGGWSSTGQQSQAASTWAIGHMVVAALFNGQSISDTSGIYTAWCKEYQAGRNHGYAVTPEIAMVDWGGKAILVQYFADGSRCEWSAGVPNWYSG